MGTSGLDVRSHTFTRAVRGFDIAEVEAALQAVAPDYEQARATLAALEQALADATAEAERLRQSERSVIRLFRSAEEHAQIRLGSAHRDAARIVEAAEHQARAMLARAEAERGALLDDITAIERRRDRVVAALGELIESLATTTTLERSATASTEPPLAVAVPTCAVPGDGPIAADVAIETPLSTADVRASLQAGDDGGMFAAQPSGAEPEASDETSDGETLFAGIERAAPLGTARRLLLRVGNRRAAAAAAAIVLSGAAIASPGALRQHSTVTIAQVREAGVASDKPLAVPEPPRIAAPVAPESAPAAPLVVRLMSSRECWVGLTVDDRTESLTLAAGDEITRSAQNRIQLRIGDAAAATLEVNGHAIPPLGRSGQVVSRTFTVDDLSR